MEAMPVRTLSESDLDDALRKAGGVRLHDDPSIVTVQAADYKLGDTLIELKMLDDEGFAKPERQQKLAELFRKYEPDRPVIVLDRTRLSAADQTRYDRAIETPIKSAITKANTQLKRSRQDIPDAKCSVLLIVNNGYTALTHEALKDLVAHRVRNDTREIDAIVVAGVYYHSDDFDGVFLWPMDCIQVNPERPFVEYERLNEGWDNLAERFMSRAIRGELGDDLNKGPVADLTFVIDGVTYIRPAPIMGAPSKFWVKGRPRRNSSGINACPPVGVTFPLLGEKEWSACNDSIGTPGALCWDFAEWKRQEGMARDGGKPLTPSVMVPIDAAGWEEWCELTETSKTAASVSGYANAVFSREVQRRIMGARERVMGMALPPEFVLAVTEVIGRDQSNDVSHIGLAKVSTIGEPTITPLVEDVRLFHEHALALAAAYALRSGLEHVLWIKNLRYAWQ